MNQPVMIAGAGPVGLFLAAELALAGVPVVILEQAEDPASPLKRLPFGRRGLWTTTLEALYRRGLLDVLVEALGVHRPRRRPLGTGLAPAGRPFCRHSRI